MPVNPPFATSSLFPETPLQTPGYSAQNRPHEGAATGAKAAQNTAEPADGVSGGRASAHMVSSEAPVRFLLHPSKEIFMKLGISHTLSHHSPEEWAQKHSALGLKAVVFPCNHTAPQAQIDAYRAAAAAFGLTIAEVGAWSNPLSRNPEERAKARAFCIHQLELAEYVGAACCVNISGTPGEVWDGSYPENYLPGTYEQIVASVQEIIDAVQPQHTCYTLEPMPHMLPDSPEVYLQMVRDIRRTAFGVHLDLVNMLTSPRVYFDNRSLTDRCFALLSPYLRSCHLKDALLEHGLTVSIREVPCGQGGFDLGHYLRAAQAHDLPVIIEHLSSEEQYLEAVRTVNALMADDAPAAAMP